MELMLPGEDASLILAFVFYEEADRILSVTRSRMGYDFDVLANLERIAVLYLEVGNPLSTSRCACHAE